MKVKLLNRPSHHEATQAVRGFGVGGLVRLFPGFLVPAINPFCFISKAQSVSPEIKFPLEQAFGWCRDWLE